MRTNTSRAITLLGLFFALTAASARAQVHTADGAVMNIPFDFAVGETRLAAGKYIVSNTTMTILLRNKDGGQSVTILPMRTLQPKGKLTSTKLVFHRYGERYFLSEVWMFAANLGHELRQSRAEREEMAKNPAGRPEVILLARR